MDFYNIANLDWSEVVIVGWLGADCKSPAQQTRAWVGVMVMTMVKRGQNPDHLRREETEGDKMFAGSWFSSGKRFASYPSVCQIGNSFKKSELWGKCNVNFTRGNVDTTEQILPLINKRDSTISRQKQLCSDVTVGVRIIHHYNEY